MNYQGGYLHMQLPAPTMSLARVFADIKTMQKDNLNDVPAESKDDKGEEEIKGLKFIAKKIKILLEKNKKIQYNDASRILINNFASEEKTQRNIKRRVYDAINVLVSAGVVEKDDNKIQLIHCQKINNFTKKQEKFQSQKQMDEIKEKVEKKRKNLLQLKSKLRLLNTIYNKKKTHAKQQRQVTNVKVNLKKKKPMLQIEGGKSISRVHQLLSYLCDDDVQCNV